MPLWNVLAPNEIQLVHLLWRGRVASNLLLEPRLHHTNE
jgi:hypothetical protein